MNDAWRIELLGGLRVLQGERVTTHFRTRKTGGLLAYLAYYGHRSHPRTALMELLWPECPLEAARQSLSVALSSLRRELDLAGPAETPSGDPEGEPSSLHSGARLIVADRTTVRLNAHLFTTDVAQFAAALHAASQAVDSAQKVRCLAEAVETYRGELLPGYFEPWVLQEGRWLAEQYFQALGQLLVELERDDDLDSALDYARRGVSMDPLREEAHRDLIRLYAASGQPAAALRQYRELERILGIELNEMPEAASRTLAGQIECLPAMGRDPVSRASAPLGEVPPVGGAVPVDSVFYIVRSTDAQFHAAVERRDSIVQIQASRQMGKRSLLAQGLQRAREAGSRVAWTDLQVLDEADLQSVDRLFLTLAEWLADQLDLDVLPHQVYNPHLGPSVNFERYLRREVLEKSVAPLVWGLDEVNRLFASECGSQVLTLFGSWHSRRGLDPAGPWGRLTLAMTYATDAQPFTTRGDSSPLQIGTRLTLTEFSVEEVADLNRRYDSPLRSPAEVAQFHQLLGGHPYRVSRGLWELTNGGMGIDAFMAQADYNEGHLLREEPCFELLPDRRRPEFGPDAPGPPRRRGGRRAVSSTVPMS